MRHGLAAGNHWSLASCRSFKPVFVAPILQFRTDDTVPVRIAFSVFRTVRDSITSAFALGSARLCRRHIIVTLQGLLIVAFTIKRALRSKRDRGGRLNVLKPVFVAPILQFRTDDTVPVRIAFSVFRTVRDSITSAFALGSARLCRRHIIVTLQGLLIVAFTKSLALPSKRADA